VLDAHPTAAGQTDVVYQIHWTLHGDDGSGHTASVYGSVNCTYTEGDPFIAFADLTQSDVEGWTTTNLGADTVAEYKEGIDTQISEQITPTSESLQPPWS
jgi:hypothetical protein